MKLCVHGLAASVCAQVRPEVNSYRLKRTQSSMLRSTVLFATIKSMTVWKFGTVAKTVYLNIDVDSLYQKKKKFEFCFVRFVALEGWYKDPRKRFSNL